MPRRGKVEKDEADKSARNVFEWQLEQLHHCECILFHLNWNEKESSAETMMLLGLAAATNRNVFITIHQSNKDKLSVWKFVRAACPNAYISTSLEKTITKVVGYTTTGQMPESNGSLSDEASSVKSGESRKQNPPAFHGTPLRLNGNESTKFRKRT